MTIADDGMLKIETSTFTVDHSGTVEVRYQRGYQPANPDTYSGPYSSHRIIGWVHNAGTLDGEPWYEVLPVALDDLGEPTVFDPNVGGRWKVCTVPHPMPSMPKTTTVRNSSVNARPDVPCRPVIRQGVAV